MGRPCSPMRASLAPRASCRSRSGGAYLSGLCRVWIKVRNPASIAVQRERSGPLARGETAIPGDQGEVAPASAGLQSACP
jgi:hypothetical protein